MTVHEGHLRGEGRRVAVLVSRFNRIVTDQLLEGAVAALRENGVDEGAIEVFRVPGAWELPAAARRVLASGRHDALIALGCVIRGETAHFDYVAGEASYGLGAVARDHDVPVVFGVLTTETLEQALERAGGKGGAEDEQNRGRDAALTALEMADFYERLGRG